MHYYHMKIHVYELVYQIEKGLVVLKWTNTIDISLAYAMTVH